MLRTSLLSKLKQNPNHLKCKIVGKGMTNPENSDFNLSRKSSKQVNPTTSDINNSFMIGFGIIPVYSMLPPIPREKKIEETKQSYI
jgi:hypothetical protein